MTWQEMFKNILKKYIKDKKQLKQALAEFRLLLEEYNYY